MLITKAQIARKSAEVKRTNEFLADPGGDHPDLPPLEHFIEIEAKKLEEERKK